MTSFHNFIDIGVGLFSVLFSLIILIFPPKFGSDFYGITTKQTLRDKTTWAAGQKLFALSLIAIGVLFILIGNTNLRDTIPAFAKFALLIGLWISSKYIVNKIIETKYPIL